MLHQQKAQLLSVFWDFAGKHTSKILGIWFGSICNCFFILFCNFLWKLLSLITELLKYIIIYPVIIYLYFFRCFFSFFGDCQFNITGKKGRVLDFQFHVIFVCLSHDDTRVSFTLLHDSGASALSVNDQSFLDNSRRFSWYLGCIFVH